MNCFVFLLNFLKSGRHTTLVSILDRYPIYTLCCFFMFGKVLDPSKALIVIGPPIGSCFNGPTFRQTALSVPTGKVILALDNQKQRDSKLTATDASNGSCPFPIARLYSLAFPTSISTCNNHLTANYAHSEFRIVEVEDIAVYHPLLVSRFPEQVEPFVQLVRILE